MNRSVALISILLSVFLTVFLWNICPSVVKGVDRLIFDYEGSIPTWILFHGDFALSFGLIPFCSYLIWRFGKYSSILSLIIHSITLYVFSVFASTYILVNYFESSELVSPILPRADPFQASWTVYLMNFVIPLSVLLPLLVLLTLAFLKRRKIKQPEELDQSEVS